jgi:hypothetical protein
VNKNAAYTKDAERRTKGVFEPGKLGGYGKSHLPTVGDPKNGTAGL